VASWQEQLLSTLIFFGREKIVGKIFILTKNFWPEMQNLEVKFNLKKIKEQNLQF